MKCKNKQNITPHLRRAVSPIIAVVLIIALTAAAAGTVWVIFQQISDVENGDLFIEKVYVTDVDDNSVGDTLTIQVRNIGTGVAIITDLKVEEDGVELTSWTLLNDSYTLETGQIGFVFAQTLTLSDQINTNSEILVSLSGDGVISNIFKVLVPNELSGLPEVFSLGTATNTSQMSSQGWTTTNLKAHGGSNGNCVDDSGNTIPICLVGGDIYFETNDDVLYWLNNDAFKVKNGVIEFSFLWGDNDAMGVMFRMIDTNNYYWIGYTEDHNGPNNRAGDSTTGTPYFTYDARFELHKVEAGVNTILANSTAPFSLPPGTQSSKTGPFKWMITFSGNTISLQATPSGSSTYQEIFTITDSTFSNAGYFGVFSLAAQYSVMQDFSVVA